VIPCLFGHGRHQSWRVPGRVLVADLEERLQYPSKSIIEVAFIRKDVRQLIARVDHLLKVEPRSAIPVLRAQNVSQAVDEWKRTTRRHVLAPDQQPIGEAMNA
jgi:hypothetical protein